MDLRGSEYFKICGSAWNFFKESLPARNDQNYWDNIIEKGDLITQAYKNTKYYCFAIRQVIEECRNWMPEPYRITPEELEEINQLLEEMDKMEQRGGRGSRGR